MTLDDLPVDGKPVTWRYAVSTVLEAAGLLAFGYLLLTLAALLDAGLKGIR